MNKTILGPEAVKILASGQPLTDFNIAGCLNLCDKSLYDSSNYMKLELSNCEIEAIYSPCVDYTLSLIMDKCKVQKACFHATYFTGGLEMCDCEFTEAVDFSCGGHNRALIRFDKTLFHGFARFWDCWFTGPVEVTECTFKQGTDLLDFPYLKDVDGETIIGSVTTKDNIGVMDIKGYDYSFPYPDFTSCV